MPKSTSLPDSTTVPKSTTRKIWDAIIVGGGPAGSTAARELSRGGMEVLLLDKSPFPRLKLCAGWITPDALADLEMDPGSYPHQITRFDRITFHMGPVPLPLPTTQYSIRRVEFDAWLLARAAVPVELHRVERIEQEGDLFVVDNLYRAKYIIGAGGTGCPVYRSLFQKESPRPGLLQAVAMEEEFESTVRERRCLLWFFQKGLPGYAWYVPKGEGVINIGIGAMAEGLRRRGGHIQTQWKIFTEMLVRRGIVPEREFRPGGHTYYLHHGSVPGRKGNAFLVGDALGLATRDMAEGIGPSVRSAILASRAILKDEPYDPWSIPRRSIPYPFAARLVERSLGLTRSASFL